MVGRSKGHESDSCVNEEKTHVVGSRGPEKEDNEAAI